MPSFKMIKFINKQSNYNFEQFYSKIKISITGEPFHIIKTIQRMLSFIKEIQIYTSL
jgi:hypothetical protein